MYRNRIVQVLSPFIQRQKLMNPLLNVIVVDTVIEDIPSSVEVLVSVSSTSSCLVDVGTYSHTGNRSSNVSGTPELKVSPLWLHCRPRRPMGIITWSNEPNGISNHWQIYFLFNSLFGTVTNESWKLCIIGPLWGEFIGDRYIPLIGTSNAKSVPASWHHHGMLVAYVQLRMTTADINAFFLIRPVVNNQSKTTSLVRYHPPPPPPPPPHPHPTPPPTPTPPHPLSPCNVARYFVL